MTGGVAWSCVPFSVFLEGGIEGVAEAVFIEDTVMLGCG